MPELSREQVVFSTALFLTDETDLQIAKMLSKFFALQQLVAPAINGFQVACRRLFICLRSAHFFEKHTEVCERNTQWHRSTF